MSQRVRAHVGLPRCVCGLAPCPGVSVSASGGGGTGAEQNNGCLGSEVRRPELQGEASGMCAHVPQPYPYLNPTTLCLGFWVLLSRPWKPRVGEGPSLPPGPLPGARRRAGEHVCPRLPHRLSRLLGLPHVEHRVGRGRRGCPGSRVPHPPSQPKYPAAH